MTDAAHNQHLETRRPSDRARIVTTGPSRLEPATSASSRRPASTTVNRLDYERRGTATSVEVALEDFVLVTTGSQAADLSAGR